MVVFDVCPYNIGKDGMKMKDKHSTNWIWHSDWSQEYQAKPQQVFFRKTFELTEVNESKIELSADSRYKLYINEQLVEIGPSKGDNQIWFYDQIDITSYLKVGQNVIAIKVLRYPLDHSKGNHSIFRTKTPGLYFYGEFNGVKVTVIRADESWKSVIDPCFEIISESDEFAPMQIYEKVAGNHQYADWMKTSYDDSDWSSARVYQHSEIDRAVSPGNLMKNDVPKMYRKPREFASIMTIRESSYAAEDWEGFIHKQQRMKIPAHSKEIIEISAGEEMTGYLKLQVSTGRNAKIKILQSEAYVYKETAKVNGLTIHVKGNREDYQKGYLDGFTDEYHVGGFGTEKNPEIYEPFWLRTFRFIRLEIETFDEALLLHSFDYEETGYPLEVQTKVTTSDQSLGDIWKLSERTLRRCMHETYEDCPFYEQLQYLMDSRSQILYTYAISADDRLARKCMDDFKRSQRYDGTLNASYPCYGSNVIPGFSIYYILMVYDHMMHFDDRELIHYHFPTIENILNYFYENTLAEGYVGKLGGLNGVDRYWSFTDWTPEWNDTSGVPQATLAGPITMESLLYILGLQTAAKIAKHVDQKDLAAIYEQRADAVKMAIHKYCMGKNGMIQDGPGIEEYSQHCQVFGALTETLTKAQAQRNILETIHEKEAYAQCSVAMSFYLFQALQKVDLYELTDDYWEIWRKMLANNATTSVEAEAGERSECHAWGALALYELPSVILGVQPAEPGYRSVLIQPTPGYLKWAKGEVITPKGMVKVAWEKSGEDLIIDYQVPKGMSVLEKSVEEQAEMKSSV